MLRISYFRYNLNKLDPNFNSYHPSLYIQPPIASIHFSIYIFVQLPTHTPLHPPTNPSSHPPTNTSSQPPTHTSTQHFICPSVHLSIPSRISRQYLYQRYNICNNQWSGCCYNEWTSQVMGSSARNRQSNKNHVVVSIQFLSDMSHMAAAQGTFICLRLGHIELRPL